MANHGFQNNTQKPFCNCSVSSSTRNQHLLPLQLFSRSGITVVFGMILCTAWRLFHIGHPCPSLLRPDICRIFQHIPSWKYNPTNDTRPTYFRESHTDSSHSPEMHVILCNSSHRHLSWIDSVCPSQGELFYLHWILQHWPALSFVDAHTIDDHLFRTYQEAATAMGLFADENKGIYALREAIKTLHTLQQLRILLVHLLVNDLLPTPINVWNDMHEHFALDFRLKNGGLIEIGVDCVLQELTTYLEEYGKWLANYELPEPDSCLWEVEHEMVHWGGNREMLAAWADRAYDMFNNEQKDIYEKVFMLSCTICHSWCLLMGKRDRVRCSWFVPSLTGFVQWDESRCWQSLLLLQPSFIWGVEQHTLPLRSTFLYGDS